MTGGQVKVVRLAMLHPFTPFTRNQLIMIIRNLFVRPNEPHS